MSFSQAISHLKSRLSSYLEPKQIDKVVEAFDYAEKAHSGQMRRNGEPYITHPLAVANILADFHMDHYSICAAMLHDVIEDCGVTKEQINKKFGNIVAQLVDGVSKLNQMEFSGQSREEQQAANFQKMAMAMSRDLRVILVKLADRLHNMRTLGAMPQEKRQRISRETLEIYAPIAQRLGINAMRIELEDLGFKNLYPLRSIKLRDSLDSIRGNRRDLVIELQDILERRIEQENIEAKVLGREKHLYSIYRKIRNRKISFKDMKDIFAFRIVVETVDECYRVLGIIHSIFKPIIGTFKDYIAVPKVNGYQSLHTIVLGSQSESVVPIEVQIRTEEMDKIADHGIAAHSEYKKGNSSFASIPVRASEWITDVLEMQQNSSNAMEFIEHVKKDLFPSDVYVFTPTGEIIALPRRATALDFAYHVHTDVGNKCVGCRLNNRLATLSEPLENGQVVEIITDKRGKPNIAWLDYVVSAKARSAILNYLKHQRGEDAQKLGEQMLNQLLVEGDTSISQLSNQKIKKLLIETNHANIEELYEQIGLGKAPAFAIASLILSDDVIKSLSKKKHIPLVIDNSNYQSLSYAVCCNPIPGDTIYSHFTSVRGIVIHRYQCKNIRHDVSNPEVCMPVCWAQTIDTEFYVEINVEVEMFRGVIGSLANKTAENNAGVNNISLVERGENIGLVKLQLLVKDRVHLANVMRKIRLLSFVHSVKRRRN